MCVSFRCRYIRLEKLDKSSQDTLSLLVARSGTKRNRPPPSEKLAFQTPPADFAKCRRLQSVLFTLYPISPGSHIYPGTRRDIAALVGGVKTSTLSLRKVYIKSGIGGRRAGSRIFYKFTSKVLWSRRHLTSWKRLPLGSQIPSSLVPLRVSKQRERACGEFIKILQPSVCLLIPNLNMNFPKLLLCYLIWCSAH